MLFRSPSAIAFASMSANSPPQTPLIIATRSRSALIASAAIAFASGAGSWEGVAAATTVFAPAEEEPADEFKIVRSKRFSIKPMSAEEAILQMNLLDHEFFVFRNMDADDAIAVVYKRRQGGYGLICDDGLDAD